MSFFRPSLDPGDGDPYAALGVRPDATAEEIRASFRRLALRHHPDRNRDAPEKAMRRFLRIRKAYETLKDPVRRMAIDRARGGVRPPPPPAPAGARPREPWLVLLDDLLNGRPREALRRFEVLLARGGPGPLLLARLEDVFDGKFLLAEAYDREGLPARASILYREVLELAPDVPGRAYLVPEVRERLWRLLVAALGRAGGLAPALGILRDAERLEPSRPERVAILRAAADRCLETGHFFAARELLARALEIQPRMKGGKRLREALGVEAPGSEVRRPGGSEAARASRLGAAV